MLEFFLSAGGDTEEARLQFVKKTNFAILSKLKL